jgi:hypothetical protein
MVINLVECLTFESPIERRSLEGGRREGMDEGGWRREGEGGGGKEWMEGDGGGRGRIRWRKLWVHTLMFVISRVRRMFPVCDSFLHDHLFRCRGL